MKEIKNEIKIFIAEKLLGWAFDISPNNDEGKELKYHIAKYFNHKVNHSK